MYWKSTSEETSNARHHRIDHLVHDNRGRIEHHRGDAPADRFSVFGLPPPGASRTLFPFGIAVGAVTSLGLLLLLTDLRPAASRAADARRAAARIHRQAAFMDQNHDTKLEHQARADRTTGRRPRPTGSKLPQQ